MKCGDQMVEMIKIFLQEEGLHYTVALSTLLDALYDAGEDELAEELEDKMEEFGIPSTDRVATLLSIEVDDEEEN